MRRLTVLAACLAAIGAAPGGSLEPSLECEKIKQRIEAVRSKMRAGYTRAEGEKLAAELRRLRILRGKACR